MKIIDKINEKLKEKKQYEYIIDKESLFNVGVITALGLLDQSNRELMAVTKEYAELTLFMDMEQKAAIDLALRDFIVKVIVVEEPKQVKAMVWK